MVSGFTLEKLGLLYTLCRHIGLLLGKGLDTILLRHRIRKYSDSPSTRYRIRCDFFFHFGERIQKCPDSLPNLPDACGRKPYPERKSCGFKNIRIRVDGALVFVFILYTSIKSTQSRLNAKTIRHSSSLPRMVVYIIK